jgi:cobalt-zinc-cadmium efflux system membrane fusion protein
MLNNTLNKILFSFLLFSALLMQAGCGKTEKKPAAVPQNDPMVVEVGADFIARLSMAEAKLADVEETLRVPARIEVDGQKTAKIGAAVTGRVSQILATSGQRVVRGTVLATLNSTELSSTQLAYLKLIAQENLQVRAVERAKLLYGSDVISAAELQKRESELAQVQTERQAMQSQLKVLGMTEASIKTMAKDGDIHALSSVISTTDGTVIERNVTIGQVVQPSDALFTVSDLRQVWLVAEVPEQQISQIREGGKVLAEVPALDTRQIEGRLIYVSDVVDTQTRSVVVRMEVDNRDHGLKPGMLASMLLHGDVRKSILIPEAAIVRENNRDFVFLQTDKQKFRLVPVKTGPASDENVAVLDGIKAGDRIVIGGAFHLNNERKRKELGAS